MTPTDDLLEREHDMITPELRAIYNKRNPTEDDLIAMATSEAERALLSLPPHCHPTPGGLRHDEDRANACAHRCWSLLCLLARVRAGGAGPEPYSPEVASLSVAVLDLCEKAAAAALESDRALLRRVVEAWDTMQARFGGDYEGRFAEGNEVIDEARARVGGGK